MRLSAKSPLSPRTKIQVKMIRTEIRAEIRIEIRIEISLGRLRLPLPYRRRRRKLKGQRSWDKRLG
jgi:hypothetical protein